jgi:uncharacterized protein (TIGR03000 family)
MPRTKQQFTLALAVLTILGSVPREGSAEEKGDKKPVVIVVRLPADADLFIGGVKSKQQSAVREFDTPPLSPGKKYSYSVKGVWKDGEKEEIRETTIIIQAGETKEINLLEMKPPLPPIEKIPAPVQLLEPEKKQEPKLEPKQIEKNLAPVQLLEPEKKQEPKPEPKQDPEPKPEIKKNPEPKLEPEKKPELKSEKKPEPEKKNPEPKPKPEKKPAPAKKPEPKLEKIPESGPEFKKEPEPVNQPKPKSEPKKPEAKPAPKGTIVLQMPETLNLQPGGTKLLPIKVVRNDCQGPVSIKFEGLPPGVELKEATLAADKQKGYILAAAPTEAEEKVWEVKIIGVCGSVRQDCSLKIKIAK